jgi:hypothetical protein
LRFASHAAFTPELAHKEILAKSGADKAKSEREASERLEDFKFPNIITDGIFESVRRLKPNGAREMAVRFDPGWEGGSAGTGIGTTGIVAVPKEASLESMVPLIEREFKSVLISVFAPSVAAFKARKKTEGKLGIQLMPIQGADVVSQDGMNCVWPAISVSYLGKVNGKALITGGLGFDGANGASSVYSGFSALAENFIGFSLRINEGSKMIRRKDGGIVYSTVKCDRDKGEQSLLKLGSMLDRQTRPAYLEIVNASLDFDDWVATQYCRFTPMQAEMPIVENYRKVVETRYVGGTGVVLTENMYIFDYMRSNCTEQLLNWNKTHSGYLLVAPGTGPRGFFSGVKAEYYSNAGAMLFLYPMQHAFASHINGLARELGIPLLTHDADIGEFIVNVRKSHGFYLTPMDSTPEEIREFDKTRVYNAKLVVYVDEFAQKGLIARRV